MTRAGRVLHAGLQLLDRQLVDREGRMCGKVDDLELTEPDDAGRVYVSAILCGPGALLLRTGHRGVGEWLRRTFGAEPVPFGRVADIGDHITLAVDHEDVPTYAVERWVRDHVVGPIPGSGHDAAG